LNTPYTHSLHDRWVDPVTVHREVVKGDMVQSIRSGSVSIVQEFRKGPRPQEDVIALYTVKELPDFLGGGHIVTVSRHFLETKYRLLSK
jgi:hypothetical protein